MAEIVLDANALVARDALPSRHRRSRRPYGERNGLDTWCVSRQAANRLLGFVVQLL
jgi:hypothetical protein